MSGMNEIEGRKADDGPVVSEGGRSPSTLSPGHARPVAAEGSAIGPLGPGQRWSAGRKRVVVLRLLAGDSVELLSRELGLPVFKLEQWRQKAEAALDGALKERDADAAEDGQLAAALRRVGELSIRVARKRVLRLMREHHLLSPHRARPRPEAQHDRRITTDAPNVVWAIDATQVTTVQDGKVWLFGVVEHWNAEMLGWHVAKRGTRHEAIQALGMAVRQRFGHLGRDVARGLALRHDHAGAPTPRAAWGQQFHGRRLPAPDAFLGRDAELRLRRRAGDQRLHRAAVPHLERAGHPRPRVPDHRRPACCRPRLRRPLQRRMAG